MKLKKINKKPIIFISFLLVLGIVGGTFAYFYSEVVIPNNFKTSTFNVGVEEEFYKQWGTKKVTFVNKETDGTPVVLRINYNESFHTEENGETIYLSNKINGQPAAIKNWTDDFLDDFVDGGDGWYYYKKLLNPGSSIQVLESVTRNDTVIDTLEDGANGDRYKYITYTYDLAFNHEAIQATPNAISSIWGKNVTINGGNVEWGF